MMEYEFGSSGWILDHCTTENISVLRDTASYDQTLLLALGILLLVVYFALIYFAVQHDKAEKFLKEKKLLSSFNDWKEARK